MKKIKLLTAAVIAGLMLAGCGEDDGLVKLENANPAIKQANYDAMVNKLKERVKNVDFEFYHAQTLFNGENWKNYTSEQGFAKFTRWKAQHDLINNEKLVVVVVDNNNKKVGSAYEVECTKWGKFECDPEYITVLENGKR